MTLVAGAVLTGGASRRMGRDKALLAVGGRPLAVVAATALRAAGAVPVVTVGGDGAALAAHGLDHVPDRYPGEGPLGGILTALSWSPAPAVVVLSCDLPTVSDLAVRPLLAALDTSPDADVVAAEVGGRPQFLAAAYRRRAAPALEAAFGSGERAVRRAVGDGGLRVAVVEGIGAADLLDVDTPEDLDALGLAPGAAAARPWPPSPPQAAPAPRHGHPS